jgi:hypothetical protein
MNNEPKRLKILLLIAGLMLCLGVFPTWPHGFYILLRFIVCGAAVYVGIALRSHASLNAHFIPLMILGALFNPLIPINLTRLVGLPIDLGVAVYFLFLSKKL